MNAPTFETLAQYAKPDRIRRRLRRETNLARRPHRRTSAHRRIAR